MDNETRLHFIKSNVILPKKNGQVRNLYSKDFEWLIEQVEKIEILQKGIESSSRVIDDMVSDYEEVQSRISLILSDVKHVHETIGVGEHDQTLEEVIRSLEFLEKYVNGWLIKID